MAEMSWSAWNLAAIDPVALLYSGAVHVSQVTTPEL
jgi:hypothetical protein